MALSADLFLQAWRPSAFVIGSTVGYLGMFFTGMCFGYIVVSQALATEPSVAYKHWHARNINMKRLMESHTQV